MGGERPGGSIQLTFIHVRPRPVSIPPVEFDLCRPFACAFFGVFFGSFSLFSRAWPRTIQFFETICFENVDDEDIKASSWVQLPPSRSFYLRTSSSSPSSCSSSSIVFVPQNYYLPLIIIQLSFPGMLGLNQSGGVERMESICQGLGGGYLAAFQEPHKTNEYSKVMNNVEIGRRVFQILSRVARWSFFDGRLTTMESMLPI